jgi:hypothetical protein
MITGPARFMTCSSRNFIARATRPESSLHIPGDFASFDCAPETGVAAQAGRFRLFMHRN